MLSPLDMVVIGGAALLFFGPEQLPGVARKVGSVMRELQMTSQSFIREMERAAEEADLAKAAASTPLDIEEMPPIDDVPNVQHFDDPTPAPEATGAMKDEETAEADPSEGSPS